jgi:hypothetical protein
MTKTTTIVGLVTGLCIGYATRLSAQTTAAPLTQGYVNINAGAQPVTRTFTTTGSTPIYGEQATFEAGHHVSNGAIFDVNGGVRVRPSIGIGAGFTTFKAKKDATAIHSSVPSPLVINSPQIQDQTVPDLNHTENAFYVQAVYFMPVTDKFEVTAGVGPAFFTVKQDLVSRIEVPAGTQAAVPIVENLSKTAVGVIAGFDLNFLFTRRIGAGLFVRYAGATADLEDEVAGLKLKVGGVQGGLGLRVRF